MISETSPCFQQHPQRFQMFQGMEDMLSSSPTGANANAAASGAVEASAHALLYNVSVLRDKVGQLESLVGAVVSPDQIHHPHVAMGVSAVGSIVQEIVAAASSIMYALQQAAPNAVQAPGNSELSSEAMDHVLHDSVGRRDVFGAEDIHYGGNPSSNSSGHVVGVVTTTAYHGNPSADQRKGKLPRGVDAGRSSKKLPGQDCSSTDGPQSDIIELDAADLLAKYTHYCQVCGKGFRRDANLRMHMRAHGDEYKTAAALTNPMKGGGGGSSASEGGGAAAAARKYSCPQAGCRWNKNHARFQPLKSMICVKNHYKRSHCPKMYVCKRCGVKQFSVLSDLRTHEKYCGDHRWRCSCGTNFSRKDKLMGHVALFVGHTPAVNCFAKEH